LFFSYFLYPFETTTVEEDEEHAYDPEKGKYLMACNGWVMGDDPMNNFAVYPSQVYLRRELIAWGDCVKLNYRQKPSDCPYLWEYMTQYSVRCAKLFHGFRIDNCHSTPIHVAEYLLSKAREIRPHLYVVAELFTGSEQIDHIFVNRLGITSLIREAQNAPDSHEQGRFVYRYGGEPVGAFRSKTTRPAPPSVAHALFYDQTHDNPPPAHKRTVYDHVPTAAMTSIAYCASGSNRGYDEFIPFQIDVVQEARQYTTWPELEELGGGMVKARKLFNDMHFNLCANGFTELFVDQINVDTVAVTRHNPLTHESVLVISHTCFSGFNWNPAAKEIHIADNISEILFEVKTIERPKDSLGGSGDPGKEYLTGDTRYSVEIYENVPFEKSGAVKIQNNTISFNLFPSGSVIAFKITPKPSTIESCNKIESLVSNDSIRQQLKDLVKPLSHQKLNFILFRCEKEDLSEFGEGAYELSNVGKFVYCGIEGIYPMIKKIQETNDLGHPLCANLRDGHWLCDYIIRRLRRLPEIEKIANIFEDSLGLLKDVPHFLRPCYFELIFIYLRDAIVEATLEKLNYSAFADTQLSKKLALNSIAFLADIASARLPPIENPSLPDGDSHANSLAAGLPHFCEGIWRNWGRDTFIALPGLLLSTGRYDDAKNIILAYGGALRHGLIPNLLGEGKCSRYNCRDAVWFWLSAIVQYCEKAPNGESILKSLVARIYPRDDSEYGEIKTEELHETIYECLQRHYEGINFRERNAGHQIDEQMTDNGFNVTAKINHKTGFVEGGNGDNCGTWMDKMGSSPHAGNKGLPATPRDGAAVELQGLALFVAENLSNLHSKGIFPYDGLHNEGRDKHLTWLEWAKLLRTSFPEHFYVSDSTDHELVNRRNIIKDSYGSTQKFTDFQLRPNFTIALSLVPDIVSPEQAWQSLLSASKILLGPLGIRTLDPSDWAYNGNYFNDDQSSNKATAAGWNYHQGPEWLWVAGCFLRAMIRVAEKLGTAEKHEAMTIIKDKLYTYQKHISTFDWRSLPELTNKDGAFCPGSCPAQAWSIGCLIEATEAVKNSL
jgi:glycogen debranching enzyme